MSKCACRGGRRTWASHSSGAARGIKCHFDLIGAIWPYGNHVFTATPFPNKILGQLRPGVFASPAKSPAPSPVRNLVLPVTRLDRNRLTRTTNGATRMKNGTTATGQAGPLRVGISILKRTGKPDTEGTKKRKKEQAYRVGRNRRISGQRERAQEEKEKKEEEEKNAESQPSTVVTESVIVAPSTPAAHKSELAPTPVTPKHEPTAPKPKGPIPVPPRTSGKSAKSTSSVPPLAPEVTPVRPRRRIAQRPKMAPGKASSPPPPASPAQSAFPAPSARNTSDGVNGQGDFKKLQMLAAD